MIATFMYVICMLLIPRAFKNAGIQYVVQDKMQGFLLVLLSKTLWWMACINVLLIWFPQWQTYFVVLCALGLSYSLYKDRSYVIFDWNILQHKEKSLQRAKY